jgi:hypothetical protein
VSKKSLSQVRNIKLNKREVTSKAWVSLVGGCALGPELGANSIRNLSNAVVVLD